MRIVCWADDSHEISYLIFFKKIGKMSQNLSSAAMKIGVLRDIYILIFAAHIATQDGSKTNSFNDLICFYLNPFLKFDVSKFGLLCILIVLRPNF